MASVPCWPVWVLAGCVLVLILPRLPRLIDRAAWWVGRGIGILHDLVVPSREE